VTSGNASKERVLGSGKRRRNEDARADADNHDAMNEGPIPVALSFVLRPHFLFPQNPTDPPPGITDKKGTARVELAACAGKYARSAFPSEALVQGEDEGEGEACVDKSGECEKVERMGMWERGGLYTEERGEKSWPTAS